MLKKISHATNYFRQWYPIFLVGMLLATLLAVTLGPRGYVRDIISPLSITKVDNLVATGTIDSTGNILARAGVTINASGPTITAGSAAPSSSQPTGSVYFRTSNGTIYANTSSPSPGTTWTLQSTTTGTVTSVAAGTGLSASPSPIVGSGTLTLNMAGASCSAGQAVTAINATGTGTCSAVSGSSTFSGARVRFAGGVTINSGTDTLVSFDTEVYDVGTYHDNSTNPSRLTVPTTGYYYFSAPANWQADVAGIRYIHVKKNANGNCGSGGTEEGQNWISASSAGPTIHQVSGVLSMTAGDYLEFCVYHSAPGTKVLTLDLPNSFGINFIAAP